jgi:SNF2 family DNA or RNA helicase
VYDERIDVHTEWSEKDLIRQIPGGIYDGERKVWTVPLSWAAHQQLRGVFGMTLDLGPKLIDWAVQEYETRVKPALELRECLALEGPTDWRPYQLADVKWYLATGDGLLANEPGTGKTVSTLTAARCHRENALPLLIICPNSVKKHWEKHFSRWYPEATPYRLEGSVANRRKILAKAADDPTAAVIINIEGVRLLSRLSPYGAIRLRRCAKCKRSGDEETELVTESRCETHAKELNKFSFKTVVLDEAHRIKDPTSKQTRACWQLMHAPAVQRRWALTGTPIANHVGDLWSVMHGVCPLEYPTKTEFIDRYALFMWNIYGTMTIADVRPDTREELYRFLDPRLRRMLKAVVLPQLPPKVYVTREAEMKTAQGRMYRELEEQMYTRTKDGRLLLTTNNLTKNLRLLQLASSSAELEPIENPDPEDEDAEEKFRVRLVEPSTKLDILEEEVEANEGKQIVVSALSRQLIELAAARLEKKKGISCVQITGAVNEFERGQNLDAFQAGKVQVLLFTLGAGGVGIDMTAADTMIRIQRSYSMLENVQGLGRIDRIGAEVHSSLHIIDVIAPGTVEEDQLERIREKEERLESIVRDRAALAKAGLSTHALDSEFTQVLNSDLFPPPAPT